ncbi:MAG: CinA family protein [Pseudomonadota bacterium]
MSCAREVIKRALRHGVVITTAESCTGGLISAALTDIAGSSAAFTHGYVTYSNAAKVEMLGITQATLDEFGAVSEEIAHEMAAGARVKSDAQIAIAVTGIAGPGGSEHKPEGRVCFGIGLAHMTHTETRDFGPLGRQKVRQATVDHALKLILEHLAP